MFERQRKPAGTSCKGDGRHCAGYCRTSKSSDRPHAIATAARKPCAAANVANGIIVGCSGVGCTSAHVAWNASNYSRCAQRVPALRRGRGQAHGAGPSLGHSNGARAAPCCAGNGEVDRDGRGSPHNASGARGARSWTRPQTKHCAAVFFPTASYLGSQNQKNFCGPPFAN